MENFSDQYTALTTSAGLGMAGPRTWIELTGEDRASFLHNLCTNDVRRLEPGQGCEAFLTNVQGKTLGHGVIFCSDDSLLFETVEGQGQTILDHLDRYLIREDVSLADRSDAWSQAWLVGPDARDLLASQLKIDPPVDRLSHVTVERDSSPIQIARDDCYGPDAFQLRGEASAMAEVLAVLDATITQCSAAAFETLRIESGRPFYGRDITLDNLPQEIGRDALAISFTKGCYLGQETVARIDALGHVNRQLGGVRFDCAEVPAAGTELTVDGKIVGTVTSATFSPKLDGPLALAFVKRGHQEPGTKLASAMGSAEVVALPV